MLSVVHSQWEEFLHVIGVPTSQLSPGPSPRRKRWFPKPISDSTPIVVFLAAVFGLAEARLAGAALAGAGAASAGFAAAGLAGFAVFLAGAFGVVLVGAAVLAAALTGALAGDVFRFSTVSGLADLLVFTACLLAAVVFLLLLVIRFCFDHEIATVPYE